MNDQVLTLTGPGYGLTLHPEAVSLKNSLLEKAGPIFDISSEEDLTDARGVIRELGAFRIQLEKSRKLVKEPVLELARSIDDAAALSAVSNALPPGTAMRSAGTVEHGGQTRAVFEFIECAGVQESNDGKTWTEVNQ